MRIVEGLRRMTVDDETAAGSGRRGGRQPWCRARSVSAEGVTFVEATAAAPRDRITEERDLRLGEHSDLLRVVRRRLNGVSAEDVLRLLLRRRRVVV